MAYSNINGDKKQREKGFGLKKLLFVVGMLIVIFSSFFNILGKYRILKEAELRNRDLGRLIQKTEDENKKLMVQIQEATSSGYMDRKAREYLGLGTNNDFWLVLPATDGLKLNQEISTDETKPIIMEWWELFTK